ncbi:MAG: TolC family outer membrane protein [Zoogloeaceae bacterium]|nr:TolC family outer membrane protein [Zoogloeaceae bacterium]
MKFLLRGRKFVFLGAYALSVLTPVSRADDLFRLYQDALENDAVFLAARTNTEAEHEAVPQARAQLLPNLSFSGSRSKNTSRQTSRGLFGEESRDYDYDSHSYTLTVRQPLFRPYLIAAYSQARARSESAEAALRQGMQEVALRVGEAYLNALLIRSELEVNAAQREACRIQLLHAQKTFAAGFGTRTDIDEAQSRLDLADAQALELEHRREYALNALTAIVNRPLTSLTPLKSKALEEGMAQEFPALEIWLSRAETDNPRLQSLRADIKAAEQEVQKARAGRLPTVDLVAQRSKSESDSHTNIGSRYDNRVVGLQVSVPIFSGGYVNSAVRQTLLTLDSQKMRLEASRREVVLAARKEFDTVFQGARWIRAYARAVHSAEQTLRSTKKGLEAGTRQMLDILNAEQALAAARRDWERGRHQYLLARLRLLALTARLDEEEMRRFNAWFGE